MTQIGKFNLSEEKQPLTICCNVPFIAKKMNGKYIYCYCGKCKNKFDMNFNPIKNL